MGDHEIDRMPGLAAVVAVQIAGAGKTRGQRAGRNHFDPELVLLLAQRVAVQTIPLRPAGREIADLIRIAADRPRLGDQVDAGAAAGRARRQFGADAIERIAAVGLVEVEAAVLATVAQHRGQVETEAVHAERIAPISQRIDDQILRDRMTGVVVAADAGVVPRVLKVAAERIIGRIVEAAERQQVVHGQAVGAAPGAAFAGVVVDHVDIDLDAGVVERLDHRLPFAGRAAGALVESVTAIGREVVQGHVAPVVVVRGRIRIDIVLVVLGFLHRQEFHRGHPERGQRRGLARGAEVGAAFGGGHAGVVAGQAAHVHFVDHLVLERAGGLAAERRGVGEQGHALARAGAAVLVAMGRAAGVDRAVGAGGGVRVLADLARIRIEQQLVRIEAVAGAVDIADEAGAAALGPGRVVRPVRAPGAIAVVDRAGDAVAVLDRRHRDRLRPHLAGRVLGQHQLGDFLRARRRLVQPYFDPGGARGIHAEI